MKDNTVTSSPRGGIGIDNERCKGCGLCIEACPKGVIAFTGKNVNSHGYTYVVATDAGACIGCASCGVICPDGCITVYRSNKIQ